MALSNDNLKTTKIKSKKIACLKSSSPHPPTESENRSVYFLKKKSFLHKSAAIFCAEKKSGPGSSKHLQECFFLIWRGGEGSMGVTPPWKYTHCYYPHRCRSAMTPWRCLAMISRRWNTYIPCDRQPRLPLSYATHTYLRQSLLI